MLHYILLESGALSPLQSYSKHAEEEDKVEKWWNLANAIILYTLWKSVAISACKFLLYAFAGDLKSASVVFTSLPTNLPPTHFYWGCTTYRPIPVYVESACTTLSDKLNFWLRPTSNHMHSKVWRQSILCMRVYCIMASLHTVYQLVKCQWKM